MPSIPFVYHGARDLAGGENPHVDAPAPVTYDDVTCDAR
jgi:hypothetical protein